MRTVPVESMAAMKMVAEDEATCRVSEIYDDIKDTFRIASGARTRSSRCCSVLVDESAEDRVSSDRARTSCFQLWPAFAPVRRKQAHRSVGPVVVVVPHVLA